MNRQGIIPELNCPECQNDIFYFVGNQPLQIYYKQKCTSCGWEKLDADYEKKEKRK